MNIRALLYPVIGIFLFFSMLAGGIQKEAEAFDPHRDYSETTIEKLKQNPESHTNTHVKFHVLYHRIEEMWSPFYSPFDHENYVSFSGWPGGAHLWNREEMVDDFPFLFIRNEAETVNNVLSAERFDLIEIKGTVVASFQDRPWIEVHHAHRIKRDSFTKESLQAFILASEAEEEEEWEVAYNKYREGMRKANLPESQHAWILYRLTHAAYRLKKWETVIEHGKKHKKVAEEPHDRVLELIDRAEEVLRKKKEKKEREEEEEEEHASNRTGRTVPGVRNARANQLSGSSLQEYENWKVNILQKKIYSLSGHLMKERQERIYLENQNNSLQERLARIKKRMNEKKKQIASLQNQLAREAVAQTERKQDASSSKRVARAKKKTKSTGGSTTNRTEAVAVKKKLKNAREQLEVQQKKYKRTLRVKENKITSLEKDVTGKEQRIQKLERRLREMRRENSQLSSRIRTMESNDPKSNPRESSARKAESTSNSRSVTDISQPPFDQVDARPPEVNLNRVTASGFRSRQEVREDVRDYRTYLQEHFAVYRKMAPETVEQMIYDGDIEIPSSD